MPPTAPVRAPTVTPVRPRRTRAGAHPCAVAGSAIRRRERGDQIPGVPALGNRALDSPAVDLTLALGPAKAAAAAAAGLNDQRVHAAERLIGDDGRIDQIHLAGVREDSTRFRRDGYARRALPGAP